MGFGSEKELELKLPSLIVLLLFFAQQLTHFQERDDGDENQNILKGWPDLHSSVHCS